MIEHFGTLPNGRNVEAVLLQNGSLRARILTFGATLHELQFECVPSVVSGGTLEEYLGQKRYFGAVVGRVANRIAGARFELGAKSFAVDANENGKTCLHGGAEGAGAQLWQVLEQGRAHVVLGLRLEDGHMGFPGTLEVQARYELRGGALRLEISAKSDADTPCSFASHAFWTLGSDLDAHHLHVAAEAYLPVDQAMIPTGQVAKVAGTSFDFRRARAIAGAALDHNFCLSAERRDLRPVLWLTGSDLALEVATTESGVQLYDARHAGRCGLAIEPQVWPDAINQPGFPDVVLRAGESYRAISEFRLARRGATSF